jgi:hypothetical protein
MHNIGTHLRQGVLSWLLGTTAQAGLQLPAKFDVRGIVLLIAGLLGLTWANIRGRITRKVPDQAVTAAETGVPLVVKAKKEGVGGLWDDMKARVGDLKQNLISKVIEYLTPTIVIAGIMWVLSLLNPASAFVRAVKLIIDIVRFVIERARQIIDFVNAVLDAVIAIAQGGGGGVPALIERALARSIPVLIGFLAALLGIGGIAGKIKQIFQALAKPVNTAIDWVIDKIVGLVKKLWSRLKRRFDRPKAKHDRTKPAPAHRKDDRAAHRKDDRTKPAPARRKDDRAAHRKDDRSDRDQLGALDAALRDARALVKPGATVEDIRAALPGIRRRHRLTSLTLIIDRVGDLTRVIHFRAVINPERESPPEHTILKRKEIEETYGILERNQRVFQEYANEYNLVIDVRPTNPESVPHLKGGALYKPVDIKAKTIKVDDVPLGADSTKVGLVGFFKKRPPREPARGAMPQEQYDKLHQRWRMRMDEIAKYGGLMDELATKPVGPGRYEVGDDQVVYGYDVRGRRQPVAGDHDMFRLCRADGSELSEAEYSHLVRQMQDRGFGVQHGAVVQWDTEGDPDAARQREELLEQHKRGGEGLIRFAPHRRPRFVYAETPIT